MTGFRRRTPSRRRRTAGVTIAAALLAAIAFVALCGPASAAAGWRLEQPAPPAGAPFKVPLGTPGDLEFYAPNRGLLSVQGNAIIAQGLYYYNGVSWTELSTVCGGSAETSRIAWAGPDEFWTITSPSLPRQGSGIALCHFKDGQVVASYSTPDQSPDPFHAMDSAACNGPDDCWFGGVGSQDPSGARAGAFHLHWDGTNLTTVYAPQGRGISDIQLFNNTFYETNLVGIQREDDIDKPPLTIPEPTPLLVRTINGTTFGNAPFAPQSRPGVPLDGTELLAASANASDLWLVGGGAASGPDAPKDGSVARPPIAVEFTPGSFFRELALPSADFGPTDRFGDVAAVPGTPNAWVTDVPFEQRASTTAKAKVALLSANGQVVEQDSLPVSGAGRGSAARIAFTSPTEGWMVTTAGWLFHYTDGTPLAQDTDPNFATPITFRPNEAAAQFVPDTPPADDSQLFAPPPPVEVQQAPAPKAKTLLPLLAHIKNKLLKLRHGTVFVLQMTMTVRRSATLQLIAKRHGKVVAKTPVWHVHKGPLRIRLQLQRKRWPTALQLKTHEKGQPSSGGGGGSSGDGTVLTR